MSDLKEELAPDDVEGEEVEEGLGVETDDLDASEGQEAANEGEGVEPAADERDYEREARLQGWKPDGPKDAQTFVEDGERWQAERKKKAETDFDARLKRMEAMNAKALEVQKERIQAEYDEKIRKAVEIGDVQAFDTLKEQREASLETFKPEETKQTTTVDPAVMRWRQDNSWFDTSPRHQNYAVTLYDEISAKYPTATPETIINEVDIEMRRDFPALYSKSSRATPRKVTDTGGRRTAAKKGKGAADLPPEAAKAARDFVEEGIYKSVDDYAKDYWEQGT